MLTREITRQGFGTARALAFPELIAAPTFPAPLRAALEITDAGRATLAGAGAPLPSR